jgi:hypothetical protein
VLFSKCKGGATGAAAAADFFVSAQACCGAVNIIAKTVEIAISATDADCATEALNLFFR